jgi:CRISPR-associated protein Cas2
VQIVLIYDIPNNRVRAKVADICLDYGLERIQFSAFTGDLRRVHQEEILAKMRQRLGKRPGKILLLPCCEKDWQARLEIRQEERPDDNAVSE